MKLKKFSQKDIMYIYIISVITYVPIFDCRIHTICNTIIHRLVRSRNPFYVHLNSIRIEKKQFSKARKEKKRMEILIWKKTYLGKVRTNDINVQSK